MTSSQSVPLLLSAFFDPLTDRRMRELSKLLDVTKERATGNTRRLILQERIQNARSIIIATHASGRKPKGVSCHRWSYNDLEAWLKKPGSFKRPWKDGESVVICIAGDKQYCLAATQLLAMRPDGTGEAWGMQCLRFFGNAERGELHWTTGSLAESALLRVDARHVGTA